MAAMMHGPRYTLELSECREIRLVGGKAANLGRLIRAGFPVPNGFAVTTRAYDLARSQGSACLPEDLVEEIRIAYSLLGGGLVAVRSSATAEDMSGASMAGQYETLLNIDGEPALLEAVQRCWASLDAPRVQTYLCEHDIDPSRVAMAVVVQRLARADVAGVLFTTNPHDGRAREMLLEASWGLGETVVSGRVQPDVLRLEQDSGQVLEAIVADKQIRLTAGAAEERPVEESFRRRSCLRGHDVYRLWQLAKRVAEHFGCPQDIEWAIHGDEVYLLQSRPITTLRDAETRDEMLRATQDHLRQEISMGRGPWVLHNMAETLPHPTPLTWSIMKRFMSGAGGFGAMYRQAGFEPSPQACRDGFLECIAGRIYMDAARATEMLFADFPFSYDLNELKHNPEASQSPPTSPRGSLWARRKAAKRLAAVTTQLGTLAGTLEGDLRMGLFPEITTLTAQAKTIDLRTLAHDQLLALWSYRESLVLDTFGPRLLIPGMVVTMLMEELRAFLQETAWDQDVDALVQLVCTGGEADMTVTANAELYEVARGTRPLATWLAEHGHRAPAEFELAEARWRERPEAVQEMADRLASGEGPLERHHRSIEAAGRKLLPLRAKLTHRQRRELDRLAGLIRRYIALREDSKDFLMRGYDLLRDVALEAGRRLEADHDVFYLTCDELFDALRVGFAPYHLIEQRKTAYRIESRLRLPRVIDADTVDTLGVTPATPLKANGYKALAVSPGQSQGPVKILHAPTEAGDLGHGYILVCPSTDPSWTPLFVNAAGLVLECGGTLSHGAVVAREMGLPAVVLPGATGLFSEDQTIRVDGSHGWVGSCASDTPSPKTSPVTPDDVSIGHELIPPPAGRKDRKAARLSRLLAIVWAAYLTAFFLLPPQYVHQPSLQAIDIVLWPIVRTFGKPAVVAVVAAGLALATLLIQWLATDNRRLREAKRRAATIRSQAKQLPAGSPRHALLTRLAAEVQIRTLAAAMIPVGILLGPMVMPFVWFRERIDPAVWNAPIGSPVRIVATVDSDWRQPIRIDVPAQVTVDDSTPASRSLPPLRETLERLLVLYRQPRDDPGQPWELKLAPDLGREQTADDLQAYLNAGIPPQNVAWLLHPKANMEGRFTVAVAAGDSTPVKIQMMFGNDCPPGPAHAAGPAGSPLKELRVVYPRPQYEQAFWRPLGFLAGHDSALQATHIATVEIGWLGLYLLVYLPVLVLARAAFRLA